MKYCVSDILRNGIGSISHLLFPPVCVFCGADLEKSVSNICSECSKNIFPVDDPVCNRCGQPFTGLQTGSLGLCGKCLTNKPPLEKVRFSVHYSRVIRRGIVQFKFHNSLYLGETLFGFLRTTFIQNFAQEDLNAIIPIPVHSERLLKRGYNQCAILAKKLGACFNIPVLTDTLVKTRNTVPQTQLKRRHRLDNIKDSFTVNRPFEIERKRILLLDDVFTTGATLHEAARTLERYGVTSTQALVLSLRQAPLEKNSEPDMRAYSDMFFVDT